jgi:hypothetical protein
VFAPGPSPYKDDVLLDVLRAADDGVRDWHYNAPKANARVLKVAVGAPDVERAAALDGEWE